jgi:hypothetical protein
VVEGTPPVPVAPPVFAVVLAGELPPVAALPPALEVPPVFVVDEVPAPALVPPALVLPPVDAVEPPTLVLPPAPLSSPSLLQAKAQSPASRATPIILELITWESLIAFLLQLSIAAGDIHERNPSLLSGIDLHQCRYDPAERESCQTTRVERKRISLFSADSGRDQTQLQRG